MDLVPLIVFLLFIAVIVWLFALIGGMASDRGHSPWPWWFLSIFWSPFGTIFVLWLFFRKVDRLDEDW
ncbi:hypothetical protein KUL25_13740 [Rhodobacteraceae bacterium N5(2021)]|uniref:Uncharacterized protein n=1 Tax=Gymnodinialimonas phycosphaerae TaxID=2841589 RepID=A0A975TTJ9_9RHOB|nr:hypothetical protein [Gymnodinialimonas phycosphaerae]MBY4893828.1 hypothetical protein [Gymnodinialimonas phycosphaerae]